MEMARFIGRGNRIHRLPILGAHVVVPRDLVEAEPALWFALEHRDAELSGEARAALAGMVVDGPGGPRPLDPALGGLLVPLAEWLRRTGAPRRVPTLVRVGEEARDPVWRGKPAGAPWPAPVGGMRSPPARPRAWAPRTRPRDQVVRTASAWVLLGLCVLALVGCLQWAIESRGALGAGQLVNGLLLLGGLAILGRLARSAGESRPARLSGRLAGTGAVVLVGSVALQLLT
jgi:hypothetical protein